MRQVERMEGGENGEWRAESGEGKKKKRKAARERAAREGGGKKKKKRELTVHSNRVSEDKSVKV